MNKQKIAKIMATAGKKVVDYIVEALCFAAAAFVQKLLLKGFSSFSNRRKNIKAATEDINTETEESPTIDPEIVDEVIDGDFREEPTQEPEPEEEQA